MASQAMFSEECMIHDEAVFLTRGFIILCNGTLHFFTPPILVGSCIFNIRFKYNISYIYSMNLSPPNARQRSAFMQHRSDRHSNRTTTTTTKSLTTQNQNFDYQSYRPFIRT